MQTDAPFESDALRLGEPRADTSSLSMALVQIDRPRMISYNNGFSRSFPLTPALSLGERENRGLVR